MSDKERNKRAVLAADIQGLIDSNNRRKKFLSFSHDDEVLDDDGSVEDEEWNYNQRRLLDRIRSRRSKIEPVELSHSKGKLVFSSKTPEVHDDSIEERIKDLKLLHKFGYLSHGGEKLLDRYVDLKYAQLMNEGHVELGSHEGLTDVVNAKLRKGRTVLQSFHRKLRCGSCSHVWRPRVNNPERCPKCSRRLRR